MCGEFEPEKALRLSVEVLQAFATSGIFKVLVDDRKVTGKLSNAQRFDYAVVRPS